MRELSTADCSSPICTVRLSSAHQNCSKNSQKKNKIRQNVGACHN